jgi:hypothetical protein
LNNDVLVYIKIGETTETHALLQEASSILQKVIQQHQQHQQQQNSATPRKFGFGVDFKGYERYFVISNGRIFRVRCQQFLLSSNILQPFPAWIVDQERHTSLYHVNRSKGPGHYLVGCPVQSRIELPLARYPTFWKQAGRTEFPTSFPALQDDLPRPRLLAHSSKEQ